MDMGAKDMNIVLDDGAKISTAHNTDAGYDLYAREDKIVPAHGSATFDTGVHVELPEGTAGLLLPKSGLNVKHDILSFGVIDAGYSGAIVAKLYNMGDNGYYVHKGDKITQLVITKIEKPNLTPVSVLSVTERGDNGFGSTGK